MSPFFLPPKFCWFLFATILFASFASFFVDLLSLAQPIYSIIDYFIVLIFYSHPSHFHIWMRSMGQTIFTLRMWCIGQTSWITLLYLVDYPLARLFYPYITTNMIIYTCFSKCCTPLNRLWLEIEENKEKKKNFLPPLNVDQIFFCPPLKRVEIFSRP